MIWGLLWEPGWLEVGRKILFLTGHSDTKPSSLDSQRIRAAKCHVWWIMPLILDIFTCTAGLAVDGVFQCHPRSVVVWYEKRLCEGRAGHLGTLTFWAKTFSCTSTFNSTLSSFLPRKNKNPQKASNAGHEVQMRLIFEIVWHWIDNSSWLKKKDRTVLIYVASQYFMNSDLSLDILFNQPCFVVPNMKSMKWHEQKLFPLIVTAFYCALYTFAHAINRPSQNKF